jgi:hypothetical protein
VRYLISAERKSRNARPTVADVAARQHGVLTTAQLLATGLSPAGITRRVASGELRRLALGVYAVGQLTRESHWLAGVLGGGPGAGLARFAAAKLWDVSRFPVPVIDVVGPRQRRNRPGVRYHRANALDPRDLTSHRGIPVTTMHRTLVDLGDVLTPHQLANVMHEAAFRGRLVPAAVRDAMARVWGRPRLWVVERALELHASGSAGTRSGAEDAFLTLGFPEPLVNVPFAGFERDFRWPERRLVVEIDGPGHDRPHAHLDDAERDATLRSAGYSVIRLPVAGVVGG